MPADRISERSEILRVAGKSVGERGDHLLAPLIEYDRRHHGDLLRTLQVYLLTGGNASQTAQKMLLHRSSLLYRLGRIEALLQLHLDSYADRLALSLALLAVCGIDDDDSN